MSKKPVLLLSALLLLGAVSLPAAARVDVDVNIGVPPPPMRVEVAPAPRVGYVWAPGYWAWGPGGRHVWVGGRWIGARQGYRWVPEHWDRRGEFHHFEAGRWERERFERHDRR